jgi:hypothetical protein
MDQSEQMAKFKDKDAEIEVLKEMIKGIKIQLKCKLVFNLTSFS